MKKIVKKIPARIVISYQCEVCGTKYRTITAAQNCEARTLEKKEFKAGDLVYPVGKRHCKVYYRPKGKIVKILGPTLPVYEYEVNWLGGKSERLKSHILQYEVRYTCPCHNRKMTHLYFAPEIKRTEKECVEVIKNEQAEYKKFCEKLDKIVKTARSLQG